MTDGKTSEIEKAKKLAFPKGKYWQLKEEKLILIFFMIWIAA
jgi:hypothetical protein